MKKLLITLIFAVLTLGLMAQENHPKGIYVGKKISDPATTFKVRIDSATSTSRVTPTDIRFWRGSTELTVAGSITAAMARTIVADSLNALRNAGATGVLLADSVNYTKGYMSRFDGVTGLAAKVAFVPDSVQHTADFTLALTDLNKDIYCLKTSPKMTITIPTTASVNIPIGSTFNFYCEGASLVHFHAASGVSMHSDMDSVTTSRIHQVVGLKKRGNNYWILYGPLAD